MASPSSSDKSSNPSIRDRPIDPITRTALRYTISPREYELLHQYLISRAPQKIQKRTPDPERYEKITASKTQPTEVKAKWEEGNVAAIRTALRVFVAVYVGFEGFDAVTRRMAARKGDAQAAQIGVRFKNTRLALSFSGILFWHKLLHRFFRRLRTSLSEEGAEPFRTRNPRAAKMLTSPYTPAVGAALSGVLLGISPADQLRMTVAIYVLSRSLEFSYNALEEGGYLWKNPENRPWWFGSWMIMPFTCGQLLHAFVFDRDCFPTSFGGFILKRSPEYIQTRPTSYPASKPWPSTFDIVDALASLSKLRGPPFVSPILFPAAAHTHATPALSKVAPITSPAHPALTHTSCALLHPHDPSCARTYLKYFLRAFPQTVKFFTLFYGAFALLGAKAIRADPLAFANKFGERVLRMSLFVTGAIGTSWASVCIFNNSLSRGRLPTQRWFLGGFLGGLWAFVARRGERGNFLYSLRLSIDSLWKVGRKRGWWKGVAGGDVGVFVVGLAVLNLVFEARPGAVRGAVIRKGMGVLRGEGFVDPIATKDDGGEKEGRDYERKGVDGSEAKKDR